MNLPRVKSLELRLVSDINYGAFGSLPKLYGCLIGGGKSRNWIPIKINWI